MHHVLRISYLSHTAFLLVIYLSYCVTFIAAGEIESHPEYTISHGDRLTITIAGHEDELTASVVVRPDGMISYPVVGDVGASGLTIEELAATIAEQLAALDYYEEPRVTVQLAQPRRETVYVAGDVMQPGPKDFPEPVSVIEAIAAAGGVEETANLAGVWVKKRRKEAVRFDLTKLLGGDTAGTGAAGDDLSLEDGDVLWIPSALKEERVSVIGHVHVSGFYRVKSNISLIQALALAGGPLVSADLKNIMIVRSDGTRVVADATLAWTEIGEKQNPARFLSPQAGSTADSSLQKMVQPGDSVIVLEKGKVKILGTVKAQGEFAVQGEISIIEALALGGIDRDSNLKKLRIVRSTGEQVTVDASKMWETKEKLGPGDALIVPRAFRINWGAVSATVLILSTLYAMFK